MFYTYILKSDLAQKTYVVHTNNLERRLLEHNRSLKTYTSRYKPWKIIYFDKFGTEKEAIQREKYYKSRTGRRWIKKNLFS